MNDKVIKFKNNIYIYPLLLYIIMTLFNNSKYGANFYYVIVPIFLTVFTILIKGSKIKLDFSYLWCILFWVFCFISTINSDLVEVKKDLYTFLLFVISYIIITATSYKKEDIQLMIKTYIMVSFLASLLIIFNLIMKNPYEEQRYSLNFLGVYKDPNYTSAFLIPACGMILYMLLIAKIKERRKKLFYGTTFFIIVLGILATGSRSALLSLIITSLLVIVYNNKQKLNNKAIRNFFVIIILLSLLYMVLIAILPESTIERLINVEALFDVKYNVRLVFWIESLKLFIKYPILGGGMASLTKYLHNLGYLDSHNVYLDILCGQGIVGFVLFGIIIGGNLMVSRKNRPFLFILLFSFFAPFFTINGFNTASLWVPMIICKILQKHDKQNDTSFVEIMSEI